jgi:RimJ/RimL family protein N-acetyltransferase
MYESFAAWVSSKCDSDDPLFYAIVDRAAEQAAGMASFMRVDCANGSVEVGGIHFSPLLQSKPAATEAMYLMM